MAWAAFWRTYGTVSRATGLSSRCRLFQHAVAPVARFRCPRWIWQIPAAKSLRQQQSRMLSFLLKIKQRPAETWNVLAQRKNALISLRKERRWDEEWKDLLHGWNGHMDRHADNFATKVRAAAVTQNNVNCWCRTVGMCLAMPPAWARGQFLVNRAGLMTACRS
jgi:hypothetical protein